MQNAERSRSCFRPSALLTPHSAFRNDDHDVTAASRPVKAFVPVRIRLVTPISWRKKLRTPSRSNAYRHFNAARREIPSVRNRQSGEEFPEPLDFFRAARIWAKVKIASWHRKLKGIKPRRMSASLV